MKVSFIISRGSRSRTAQSKTTSKGSANTKPSASRRKKLTILSIYLVALGALIAFGSSPSRLYLSGKAYTNSKYNFSIKPPKGWQTKAGQKGNIVQFTDPKSSGLDKISVARDATTLSLRQYVAAVKKALPQIYSYYTQLGEFDATVNGQPAHLLDGQAFINNDWKKTRLMIEVKKGKAYAVAAAITFPDWDNNKMIIDASLKSFRVLK